MISNHSCPQVPLLWLPPTLSDPPITAKYWPYQTRPTHTLPCETLNACLSCTCYTVELLEKKAPNSPYLNLVDYRVWRILQEEVYKTHITDLDEFIQRLRTEWAKLDHCGSHSSVASSILSVHQGRIYCWNSRFDAVDKGCLCLTHSLRVNSKFRIAKVGLRKLKTLLYMVYGAKRI